jgi:nucleotide-binding universal stress UspA family protein
MKLDTRHSRRTLTITTDERALPPIRVGTLKPRKILAPVDFTECSHKAVNYAVALAKHFHSKIILLHVARLAVPAPSAPSAELVVLQGGLLNEQVRDDAATQLSQWRDRIAAHVPARALVTSGVSVHEEIVATAHENNCDLIVIATHAKGALAHLFTGSVAEKVVHHAPCPVFVVREREHDFIQTRSRGRRSLVVAS